MSNPANNNTGSAKTRPNIGRKKKLAKASSIPKGSITRPTMRLEIFSLVQSSLGSITHFSIKSIGGSLSDSETVIVVVVVVVIEGTMTFSHEK